MENMDFNSLTGYDLNFPINFGHAATQFLADMPTWPGCVWQLKLSKKFKFWPVR